LVLFRSPVEPKKCATLDAAIAAGEPIAADVGGVAADSLGASSIGEYAYESARTLGASPILVDDDAIVEARRWLWRRCRILAEPGAATPLAALLSGAVRPEPATRTVVVISGANNPELP